MEYDRTHKILAYMKMGDKNNKKDQNKKRKRNNIDWTLTHCKIFKWMAGIKMPHGIIALSKLKET